MNTILNSKHNRKKNTEHKKTRNQFYKRIDKKKKIRIEQNNDHARAIHKIRFQ